MSIRNNLRTVFVIAATSAAIPAIAQNKNIKPCPNQPRAIQNKIDREAETLIDDLKTASGVTLTLDNGRQLDFTRADSTNDVCTKLAAVASQLKNVTNEDKRKQRESTEPQKRTTKPRKSERLAQDFNYPEDQGPRHPRLDYAIYKLTVGAGRVVTLGRWHGPKQ